jgi:hypothetical protein
MTRKVLPVFILMTIITAGAFAQNDFESMPKNTIVIDLGPTFIGLSWAQYSNLLLGSSDSSSSFGISGQYERQIMPNLALAGKIGYLGFGITLSDSFLDIHNNSIETSMDTDIKSFTLEGHIRYYPDGETFFIDGMLGYANLTTTLSGSLAAYDFLNEKYSKSVSLTATRNYINFGVKLGWRINFGRQGGFIFEPSFGYYYAVGLGDTIGKQLPNYADIADSSNIDFIFGYIENYIFIGGPRLALAFGWRF